MTATDGMAKAGLATTALLVATALGSILFLSVSPDMPPREASAYYGARILAPGPATVGLPAIPVRVEDDGSLTGIPTNLGWYDYCHTSPPGLRRDAPVSNRFVYDLDADRLSIAHTRGVELWFEPLLGREANRDDFTQDWQGAHVRWRSDGAGGVDVLPAILLKVGPGSNYPDAFTAEFAPHGFVAFLAPSTGYCCNAGYGLSPSSIARRDGHPVIYETCHDSRWDPREVRSYPTDFRERE